MNSKIKHLLGADVKLVLAALALGLAYNAVNPAGIRWSKQAAPANPAPVRPGVASGSPYGHSISALWIGEAPEPEDPYRIDWKSARPLIVSKQKFFVDIRDTKDYHAAKIDGALSLPRASAQNLLPLLVKTIGTEKGLIVGCLQDDCAEAKEVVALLRGEFGDVSYAAGPDAEWDRLTGRVVEAEADGAKYANRTVKLAVAGLIAPAVIPPRTRPDHNHGHPHAHPEITIPSVTWPEIQDRAARGEVLLVDGRSQASFDAGHIPGAICIPFAEFNQRIAEFQKKYPPETEIITYCANAKCPIAHRMAVMLRAHHDFTKVLHLPGGYFEWRQHQ